MRFATEAEQIEKFRQDEVAQHYFEVLRTLISKKSIFAQQVGLADVAHYLGEIFETAGAQVIVDETYTAPFVMARFESQRSDAKTLIFYNHYDTVPADSDQLWTEDPFKLSVRQGHMYGRGVNDDKGHITARLSAVRGYCKAMGDLPVNVIFIIEGAEESASTDLDKYLSKYQSALQGADLLIWEQGTKTVDGRLELSGGNKGIVTFDLRVQSADVDIHSKFGGIIESASWYLLQALTSMRDETGKILIDGIYDDVIPPTERELALVEEYALENAEDLQALYGLTLPILSRDRKDLLRTYFFEPALSIEGLSTGYEGQGVKTILPSLAEAKMEMRLVPGLTPERVLDKIKKHLLAKGFDRVEVHYTLGEYSYRSDMSAPPILQVIEIAKRFYEKGVAILPTSAGTGPMHMVHDAIGVPMVALGIGHANSRDHGGDENVSLADYYTHIEVIKELIASYE